MIAGSKEKSGQPRGGWKSGRKPPKMAAVPVFYQKGHEEDRENGELGFIIFAEILCVKIVNY